MTSAGGHPRTRDELADQLRAAQRGAAAPWFEQARREPPPLLLGLLAATLAYLWLDIDPGNAWLMIPAFAAMPAFQAWVAWRSPIAPSGRMPRELRRPLVTLLVMMPVVVVRALERLQERLRATPLATLTRSEDEGEPALLELDPLLDAPERIGLMSVLLTSRGSVDVDFIAERLAMDRPVVTAGVAELEQMRYLDVHRTRWRGVRCVATYAGSTAARRHRLALRRMLAQAPA